MGVWQAERKQGESNEQACSGQEWVKPCKLLTDRTWPRSLCLREGGSRAASLRQSRAQLETECQGAQGTSCHTQEKN